MQFYDVPSVDFDLKAQAIAVLFRNISPVPISSRLFPTFSSISFSVSGFMWSSLIHLDLTLVQGDRNGLILICLHDNRQLCQQHLLKMLSFFLLNGFCSPVKEQVTIPVWVHLWVFNSIPLLLVCHYTSTIQFLLQLLCSKALGQAR